MTTKATRDKWIKGAETTIATETERKARAQKVIEAADEKIATAKKRKDWLQAMPVEGGEEPMPTPVDDEEVDDDSEVFEYDGPEGVGEEPPRMEHPGADDEPTSWADEEPAPGGAVRTR